jgi:hypothetical protein
MRRCLIAVVVILGSTPGCGMAMRKMQREEMIAIESVSRSFREPSHRVALAAFEAMRSELASAEFAKDSEFFPGPKVKKPDGTELREGELLPANFPGLWVEWKSKGKPVTSLLTLGACHFMGKTREGHAVVVDILQQPDGTLVTAHIDNAADKSASKALLEKVADRLAHPASPPGSLEEAATLKAFFGGVESREALPSIRKKPAASR